MLKRCSFSYIFSLNMAAPIIFKFSIFRYFQKAVQNRCIFIECTQFGALHRQSVLVTTICSPPSLDKLNPLYLQNVTNRAQFYLYGPPLIYYKTKKYTINKNIHYFDKKCFDRTARQRDVLTMSPKIDCQI